MGLATRRLVIALALLPVFAAVSLGLCADEKPLSEKEKIESLIKHLENLKEVIFIRNGSEYDAKSAAKFLRGKWENMGKDVKTAAEFIEKIASVSSTSGKPYLIRFKDGREVKCGEHLKAELKKLEKPPAEKTRGSIARSDRAV